MRCTLSKLSPVKILLTIGALFIACQAWSLTYPLSPDSDVVGKVNVAELRARQSLMDISHRYSLSYYELLEANPTVHPKRAEPGTLLTMPTQFILPDAPREGVVVNVAELRIYVYPEDGNEVITLPVGIGRYGWETPLGEATIKDKRKDPTWTVPESVYLDMKRRGVIIPRVWPPSPKNPLGKYAMRISMPGYDIHGTNRDDGVGRRTSAGCIRMYNEDVKEVFENVEIGTVVKLVNQPFKVGAKDNKVYLEAHMPLYEQTIDPDSDFLADAKAQVAQFLAQHQQANIDWTQVENVVNNMSGIPTEIGRL